MDAELLGPLLLMNGQSWGSSKVLMLSQLLSASSCCVWIASPAERWKHASEGGGHMPHVASVPQSPLSLWEICHLAFPIFSSLTLFPSITVRQHWVLQSRMQSSAISSLIAGPGYLSWVLLLIFRTSLVPSLFYSCFLLRGITVSLLSKLLIDPWGRKCFFCDDTYCATSHLECCRATILATSYFAGEWDGKMSVFPGIPLTYFSLVYIKYPGVRTEWQLLYCVSCPKVDSVNTEVRQCDR